LSWYILCFLCSTYYLVALSKAAREGRRIGRRTESDPRLWSRVYLTRFTYPFSTAGGFGMPPKTYLYGRIAPPTIAKGRSGLLARGPGKVVPRTWV